MICCTILCRLFAALYAEMGGVKHTDYLLGQYEGFLARLSEFLVVFSCINNAVLYADNDFGPGNLPVPAGFC